MITRHKGVPTMYHPYLSLLSNNHNWSELF